jgi:2-methylcitrate dehydratase PrpD
MYQPEGYDLSTLTDGLGTVFRGEELSFKAYPCGRRAHATLDVALALYHQLDLATAQEGADITEVVLTTDPQTYREQLSVGSAKRRPTQVVEAQFSTPFLVAAALALGRVGIGEVAGVDHPRVLTLAERIQGAVRADAPEGWAQLTVRRTDGRTATLATTSPSSSPERPLSVAQLQAKFRDCAAHAVRPLPEEEVARVLRVIDHLDETPDALELIRFLV